jgi:hypothetical protein
MAIINEQKVMNQEIFILASDIAILTAKAMNIHPEYEPYLKEQLDFLSWWKEGISNDFIHKT